MGFTFAKEERRPRKVLRWLKTLFFVMTMLASLLLLSAPLLLLVADAVLPSAFLSASLSPTAFSALLLDYDFRRSLVDIPLVSILRSFIILCVYSFCNGPGLLYLAVAVVCSVLSLAFVSLKAYVLMIGGGGSGGVTGAALFVSSVGFGIAHAVAAYRTCSRRRRKLMVYKIDIEAVCISLSESRLVSYSKEVRWQ